VKKIVACKKEEYLNMLTHDSPRILVIRSGAIGDIIAMSVVFQALRRRYPSAYIEAVGPVERLQLINIPGLINTVTSIDAPDLSTVYSEHPRMPCRLITFFQQFDTILLYSFDPQNIVTQNLCNICAHQVYRFDPFPSEGMNLHITRYLLETLEFLGSFETSLIPEIAFPECISQISCPERFHLALHPGSGSSQKNWAIEHFVEICTRAVQTYQMKIVVLTGPAEEDNVYSIFTRSLPERALRFLREMPLAEIAAELRKCSLYIGNDSGISHLAATVGVSTIAIFGPSNPQVWRPLGKHVVIVRGNEPRPYCQSVSVEQVWTEVINLIASFEGENEDRANREDHRQSD
jgi:ADP-heptose:LPS heptosyltransferase